ncbi:MAG: SDR family NAD(P)-dependent oxidoreductase [Alphaproteobacteria bacterium]|nr:MAG: SDR family NAD(P)-dependent oxidoreductase [Alphaproteobacteria bacterium]
MTLPLVTARGIELSLARPATGFAPAPPPLKVLRGIDFHVHRGETVGLVGESGSGKTTLGRCLLRLIEPDAGRITFGGRDITHLPAAELRPLRARMQMIFQDPLSSLNPRKTVRALLMTPLQLHQPGRASEARCKALMAEVGLPAALLDRYPHQLSGGQRQRVGIARALAVEPDFVVADEIVSGLDVSTQAQVLRLLKSLAERLGLSMVFISHDLSVIRHICDRVVVMNAGEVVEEGPCDAVFAAPRDGYTRRLIAAIPLPEPDPGWLDRDEPEKEEGERGMKIEGCTAFVSGANRGVGAAFVEALAARGAAKIYAAARDPARLPAPPARVEVVPVRLDVTDPAQVAAAAEAAGDVTLLINNAGINRQNRIGGDRAAAEAEMATNYFGLIEMARAFAPALRANGGGMINMLSILARVTLPMMGSLCASKAAAYAATQGLRAELAGDGVQVLAVLPGAIDTEMSRDFPPPKMPPAEVANAALDALEAGAWEVYPGEMAEGLRQGLAADPIAVQKDLMKYL